MPSPYKSKPYPLSNFVDRRVLMSVTCRYCKRRHNYLPADLIEVFGDVDADSVALRFKCEGCNSGGTLDVDTFTPQGKEAVGLRIRRLVSVKIKRVPVWKEE